MAAESAAGVSWQYPLSDCIELMLTVVVRGNFTTEGKQFLDTLACMYNAAQLPVCAVFVAAAAAGLQPLLQLMICAGLDIASTTLGLRSSTIKLTQ
jgi:hypothetical protein